MLYRTTMSNSNGEAFFKEWLHEKWKIYTGGDKEDGLQMGLEWNWHSSIKMTCFCSHDFPQ